MNWTAALDSGAPTFVSLSVAAGKNLAGGASTSVDVIVDATGVPGGSTFTTSMTVRAIDPTTGNTVAGSPASIPITITIPSPAMQLSTTVLAYSATVGVNPASQSISLTNTGGDGLTWSAGTPSQSWLTLGLTSGSDNAGATSTIPFNVNVAGLASGPYTATVVITPSVGSAVIVTVSLTVSQTTPNKNFARKKCRLSCSQSSLPSSRVLMGVSNKTAAWVRRGSRSKVRKPSSLMIPSPRRA